jgi:hypothetical protein
MSADSDADLRALFHALGEEDARRAPPFSRVLRAAQLRASSPLPRKVSLRSRYALAAVLVVAIVTVLLSGPRRAGETVELAGWRSPTASLLAVPGRELLSTLPQIGDVSYTR